MRLAVVASHPIQYQAPLFRELARRTDLKVFFAHRATAADQAKAGFGVAFDWDIDLTSGYAHQFLQNRSRSPNIESFSGCDTPSVADALAGFEPDVLLLTGWRLKSDWQALIAAKRRRTPVIVRGDSQLQTPRNLAKRALKTLLYPVGLRQFDAALYVGERSRRYWTHYGYPAARMFHAPHCVDNDWFAERATAEARRGLRRELGAPDDAFLVLFAGKLADYKRPLDAVAAAAAARRSIPGLRLMVAGSGARGEEMGALASRLELPLYMLGFRNQSEMPGTYAAADILILPSDGAETWGLVANEAIACGKSIVVSDACGCALDLADGVVGKAAPVGDIDALAAALVQMHDQPPSCEALAIKATAFSLSTTANGILMAAESALRQRHP